MEEGVVIEQEDDEYLRLDNDFYSISYIGYIDSYKSEFNVSE
jgi:hypothetical protein